ncbi:MAG: type II/IV secretion system ATPase subunit [Candidatus Diapherotrites archaeon]|nr:type II/IV secretion system ATPase subunit [Candidatus Diapherotrites archaeon]
MEEKISDEAKSTFKILPSGQDEALICLPAKQARTLKGGLRKLVEKEGVIFKPPKPGKRISQRQSFINHLAEMRKLDAVTPESTRLIVRNKTTRTRYLNEFVKKGYLRKVKTDKGKIVYERTNKVITDEDSTPKKRATPYRESRPVEKEPVVQPVLMRQDYEQQYGQTPQEYAKRYYTQQRQEPEQYVTREPETLPTEINELFKPMTLTREVYQPQQDVVDIQTVSRNITFEKQEKPIEVKVDEIPTSISEMTFEKVEKPVIKDVAKPESAKEFNLGKDEEYQPRKVITKGGIRSMRVKEIDFGEEKEILEERGKDDAKIAPGFRQVIISKGPITLSPSRLGGDIPPGMMAVPTTLVSSLGRGLVYKEPILKHKPSIAHKLPKHLIRVMTSDWKPLDLISVNERYALIDPFAYANIRWNPEAGELKYYLIEPPLTEKQKKKLKRIKNLIVDFLNINLFEIKDRAATKTYLAKKIDQLVANYSIPMSREEYDIMNYYLIRDLLGMGRIEPLMRDETIEDLSCIGFNVPLYIFHRKYGSIKTNVVFEEAAGLNSFLVMLAQKSGKDISVAEPLLQGALPGGSRVSATYSSGADIATKGSTFTVRKFSKDPFTIIDLIKFGTITPLMAAYIWLALEHENSMLIAGATATGKTTILNSMSIFLPPEAKIVSIEDTPELRMPHENWVPKVARSGTGAMDVTGRKMGEVTMFDLLKIAFRERPEYIIVGEVRGQEAFVLFQMMASGHPGLSTLHADSMDTVINRLTTKPIDLAPGLIATLDLVLIMEHAKIKGREVRRLKRVEEVMGVDPNTGKPFVNTIFEWNPADDTFSFANDKSYILEAIMKRKGISETSLWAELERRTAVLNWLKNTNTRYYKDVGKVIAMYYKDPEKLLAKIKL